MPASPTTSTSVPRPPAASFSAPRSTSSSRSRPTNGRSARSSERLLPRILPDAEREHRMLLALHHEGLQRLGLEPHARGLEHRLRGEDLARLGLGHHARGEVHRVAHHRVGAAVRGAHVTHEDRAAVHADPHVDRGLRVGDLPQGEQHPLLVVAARVGRSRHQDDLAAVAVHVGAQERDAVAVGGLLDGGDEPVERERREVSLVVREHLVHPLEVDERDRDLPMLGVRPSLQEMLADRDRDAGRELVGVAAVHRLGRDRHDVGRLAAQQQPFALLRAEDLGRERERGREAHQDLARVGGVLHQHGLAGGRAGDHQLAVGGAHQEEVEDPAAHAHRHPERDEARRGLDPPDRAELAAHPERRPRRAHGMVLLGEEEHERVATELHEAAAVLVRHDEEPREDRPQDVRDLLGAHLAVARQSLGHLREPRDVDEDDRALELAHGGAGRLVQPGDQQARQVRPQPLCGIDGPFGSLGALVGRRHGPSLDPEPRCYFPPAVPGRCPSAHDDLAAHPRAHPAHHRAVDRAVEAVRPGAVEGPGAAWWSPRGGCARTSSCRRRPARSGSPRSLATGRPRRG